MPGHSQSVGVERVVLTTLAKDPHQRFASVRAFANALEQASKPQVSLPTTSSSAAPSRPVTTFVTDSPVTSLPAPPALQLPITPAPVPSEPTPANKDTVQFGPPPATPMPSISSIADSHTPPVHPPNDQILSSRSMSKQESASA